MKMSEALVAVWNIVSLSPVFEQRRDSEELKMFKQLYQEVVAVEKEKDFSDAE